MPMLSDILLAFRFMDRWEDAEMVALRDKSYPSLCTGDGLDLFNKLMSRCAIRDDRDLKRMPCPWVG